MPIIPRPPREAVILAEIKQGSLREFKKWLDEVYRLVNVISDSGTGTEAFTFASLEGTAENSSLKAGQLESLFYSQVPDVRMAALEQKIANLEAQISSLQLYDDAKLEAAKADISGVMSLQISEVH